MGIHATRLARSRFYLFGFTDPVFIASFRPLDLLFTAQALYEEKKQIHDEKVREETERLQKEKDKKEREKKEREKLQATMQAKSKRQVSFIRRELPLSLLSILHLYKNE